VARARQPIPFTVVTGPLGAGKTTLINRLLRHPAFANSAVILNEFGEAALEGGRVERADDVIIALGAGCICCAVRGELVDALERLLRELDNHRIAAIGRVIIEAAAAADPAAILAAVARHPYLSLRYRADGIVAVIDAGRSEVMLAVDADLVRQVAMADVVAVASSDGAGFVAAGAGLARLNRGADVVGAFVLLSRGRLARAMLDSRRQESSERQRLPVEVAANKWRCLTASEPS
jgi:G3E family GTPase